MKHFFPFTFRFKVGSSKGVAVNNGSAEVNPLSHCQYRFSCCLSCRLSPGGPLHRTWESLLDRQLRRQFILQCPTFPQMQQAFELGDGPQGGGALSLFFTPLHFGFVFQFGSIGEGDVSSSSDSSAKLTCGAVGISPLL